jgi:hypothetical protein
MATCCAVEAAKHEDEHHEGDKHTTVAWAMPNAAAPLAMNQPVITVTIAINVRAIQQSSQSLRLRQRAANL